MGEATLPHRIEAAEGAEQRHMLELAWQEVHGEFPGGCEWHSEANQRFARLLNAGAYLDAALMLVPKGWRTTGLGEYGEGLGGVTGRCYAVMVPRDMSHLPYTYEAHSGAMVRSNAATLPLAICAAALRAKEISDD